MRNYDDIKNDRKNDKTKEIRNDFNDLLGGIFEDVEDMIKRKKIEKEIKESKRKKRKKTPIERIQAIFLFLLTIGIGLFIINLVIGNIWLLRFFIKSLGGF